MKYAERIIMVLLLLALVGGGAWIVLSVKKERQHIRDAVARGEYEIRSDTDTSSNDASPEQWREYFPELIPVMIGTTSVQASVADSLPERIKGLSGTPYLPDGVVKLFAFGVEGEHSIWMKDMEYPIDIMWVEKNGTIVHIEKNISPETYPDSYRSPKPAWYVIEAPAGFVETHAIKKGDEVVVSRT